MALFFTGLEENNHQRKFQGFGRTKGLFWLGIGPLRFGAFLSSYIQIDRTDRPLLNMNNARLVNV